MDRIKEVGKEGICSECQEEKMIIASQGGEVFCKDCFEKETEQRTEKD
jgi:formylmethanofuran dehydrogenase subunit E